MIQSNFKCPNCEIGMEYRTYEGTHAWVCEECPIICFEYHTHKDVEALSKIIK